MGTPSRSLNLLWSPSKRSIFFHHIACWDYSNSLILWNITQSFTLHEFTLTQNYKHSRHSIISKIVFSPDIWCFPQIAKIRSLLCPTCTTSSQLVSLETTAVTLPWTWSSLPRILLRKSEEKILTSCSGLGKIIIAVFTNNSHNITIRDSTPYSSMGEDNSTRYLKEMTLLLREQFPYSSIYPVLGDMDFTPHGQAQAKADPMFKVAANLWDTWLPPKAIDSLKHG